MWLASARTVLAFAGALLGATLLRALTDLPPLAALLLGGLAGSALLTLLLGGAADRLDASLHRMGGPRVRRRRR